MKQQIERSWKAYRQSVVPNDVPEAQIAELRKAYFTGAVVLFQSIVNFLDLSVDEPTEDELKKLDAIREELRVFAVELDKRLNPGH